MNPNTTKNPKIYIAKSSILACCILLVYIIMACTTEEHSAEKIVQQPTSQKITSTPILTKAGNDAFGIIQEAIKKLNADKKTDWSKVNIEALRLHLLEVNDITLNVEVISQTPIENGVKAIIKPTTARSKKSLAAVLAPDAHPAQLKLETGWTMEVKKKGDKYTLSITSKDAKDTDKIRGLGYIGLMAYGLHPPTATGK